MAERESEKKKGLVKVEERFIPPEAHTIAAQFRNQARAVREQARNLRSSISTMESTWAGNAQKRFMSKITNSPRDLDAYASWLEDSANKIERMEAIRIKYKWEWR